jgi:hypothetical protein
MTTLPVHRRALLAWALSAAAMASAVAAPPAPSTTLNFMGTPYLHRWSQGGTHDFTPLAQSDLAKWRDKVTIQYDTQITTSEQLTAIANAALAGFQKGGLVIRTNSLAASPGRPAEHMIVAVTSDTGLRQMIFTRFRMTPEGGEVIVYSHRVYGIKPDAEASTWFKAHDIDIEKAMMAWADIPGVPSLQALPQTP